MNTSNQQIRHRPGIPMKPKEQKEYDALFQRMADKTYDDKLRGKR